MQPATATANVVTANLMAAVGPCLELRFAATELHLYSVTIAQSFSVNKTWKVVSTKVGKGSECGGQLLSARRRFLPRMACKPAKSMRDFIAFGVPKWNSRTGGAIFRVFHRFLVAASQKQGAIPRHP
jgi:hypothetical protein